MMCAAACTALQGAGCPCQACGMVLQAVQGQGQHGPECAAAAKAVLPSPQPDASPAHRDCLIIAQLRVALELLLQEVDGLSLLGTHSGRLQRGGGHSGSIQRCDRLGLGACCCATCVPPSAHACCQMPHQSVSAQIAAGTSCHGRCCAAVHSASPHSASSPRLFATATNHNNNKPHHHQRQHHQPQHHQPPTLYPTK
jgi:hypothetical protein